jgi:hypothetical protein
MIVGRLQRKDIATIMMLTSNGIRKTQNDHNVAFFLRVEEREEMRSLILVRSAA